MWSSQHRWFRRSGGMSRLSLTVSGRYLSVAERAEIACARAAGQGVRQIATLLDLFHQRDRKPQRLRDGCWGTDGHVMLSRTDEGQAHEYPEWLAMAESANDGT